MFNVTDVVDLYYYGDHDRICQISGVIEKVGANGVILETTLSGERQWFSFRAIQRMIVRNS